MAPPELAANGPVAEVFQPGLIGLAVAVGVEFQPSCHERFEGQSGQRIGRDVGAGDDLAAEFFGQRFNRSFDGDIPLVRQIRFNRDMAAVAVADLVGIVADLFEEFFLTEPLDDGRAGLEAVHADEVLCFRRRRIRPAVFVADGAIRGHDVDDGQVMPLADLPVVRVVGGRNL